jgi:hypothetical protein
MDDHPTNSAAETPMRRALRMKKATLAAKPKSPVQKLRRDQAVGIAAGASKPWMKK